MEKVFEELRYQGTKKVEIEKTKSNMCLDKKVGSCPW